MKEDDMKTAMILAGIAALSLMAWNISTQSTSTQSVPAETRKVSVQVTDISATDSPLKISGQVFFEEQVNIDSVAVRYIIDAGLLNVSSKPIMCYEVSMALSPEYGPGTNG